MSDSRLTKTYHYHSALAKPLTDFVAEKRGSGYLYNSEAKMFRRFDKFISETKQEICAISREVFEAYTAKTVYDSERNHRARYTLIRQFALYMRLHGYEAYVPQMEHVRRTEQKFVPYIFTETELQKLFAAADSYKLHRNGIKSSKLELILPVIYKMLYGGGFRVSELTHLKLSDVDFNNSVIKVVGAKFNSERFVPLNESLMKKLSEYSKKVHSPDSGKDAIFFPKHDGTIYTEKTIYNNFRTLLWDAGISHGGKGKGPRLHDLRHTFAVHRLKYWAKEGCNVVSMLPYLSAYMGHANLNATQSYLRLTVDAFPDILETLERLYGCIIPRLEAVCYEE